MYKYLNATKALTLAITLALVPGACTTTETGTGPTIVTITGAIEQTNRPRFEPFHDAFFNFHSIQFETAYAFSADDLAAFDQHEVTAKYPNWNDEVTARGPLVSDLLTHVGATGSTVSVKAFDGYTVEFDRETLVRSDAILAIQSDGTPLPTGGRGPTWLVFAPGTIDGRTAEDDRDLVWGIFHIGVE